MRTMPLALIALAALSLSTSLSTTGARAILHVEGVPEIFIFYCTRCKHAETKVQERAS